MGTGEIPVLSAIEAVVDPSRIYFLKFILEGYDNLAVLSTVDKAKGLVVLRFYPAQRREVVQLLHDIAAGIEPGQP